MSSEVALKEAVETGEILKIRYHGGSQPGRLFREIAPISVNSDKVRASGTVKTFLISKVEIIFQSANIGIS